MNTTQDPQELRIDSPAGATTEGWLSRDRSLAVVLIITSAIVGYLCYRMIAPFLPALAGALALAVIAHPLHRRVKHAVPQRDLAAGISVLLVALLVVAPAIVVTHHIVQEAAKGSDFLRESFTSGRWRAVFERHTMLRPAEKWIDAQLNLAPEHSTSDVKSQGQPEDVASPREQLQQTKGKERQSEETIDPKEPGAAPLQDREQVAGASALSGSSGMPVERATQIMASGIASVVTGSVWMVMQLLITCMTTYYFFRDRHKVLSVLRSLLPLTRAETDDVFNRINDTIHATLYGSVTVAMVQGAMGGLMFWCLGLPSPLLWGAIMAVLAVIPLLGTFVIWMPTALVLAMQGRWWDAGVLVVWGAIAIGLIDNLLYPFLVGKRMRLHTLLVFFAIVGGITLFGTSGIILGPLLLATADALLEIWRRRTAFGGTVEEATENET